jgi:hypothetical protein
MFYRDARRLYLEVLVLLNLGIFAMRGSCEKKRNHVQRTDEMLLARLFLRIL